MILAWHIALTIGGMSYLFLLGLTIYGLFRLRFRRTTVEAKTPSVSVIIAARNEEKNLSATLSGLIRQNYPVDKLEIIVTDDRSDDGTADVVRSFSEQDSRIKLVMQKAVSPGVSPKKQAIEKGIDAATGEIILTTDADTIHHPEWVRDMVGMMADDVGMVVGQARFYTPPLYPPPLWGRGLRGGLLWQRLQSLDFQSIGYASAGLVAAGMPFTCSGASFAYRKRLFVEIRGWEGCYKLISGDDELLLAKASRTGWKIEAATTIPSIVQTAPPASLRDLWQQRVRWGSKGLYYRPSRKVVLSGIFLFFLALIPGPFILLTGGQWSYWAEWMLIRLLLDLLTLYLGCRIFRERFKILEFMILEIIYPVMIVLFAAAGHFASFEWKGQTFRSRGKAP